MTEVRAGIIVGAGSAAFEVMRDMVYNLPVLTPPRWVRSRTTPIALENLLYYLLRLLDHPSREHRVFEAAGPNGQRFTLTEPWSLLLLDDARMVHETTPIQPAAPGGHRDTLVITYRRGGFQDSPAA